MKIYCLQVNQVHDSSAAMVISSYIAKRTERKLEYFQSKDSAQKRSDEIYDGVKKLTGFIDSIEVKITEIEVKP